jgi:phenylacetate-CoA ligase
VFGVAATDRYGCEEVSLIACECERHRGLHLNADSVYAEVETVQGGPLPPGAEGRPAEWRSDGAGDEDYSRRERTTVPAAGPLLVTDLSNFAMPLIRYRTGDHVTLGDRVCDCGRGLPVLERVEGRDADYVVAPGGGLVSGISLTENFATLIPGAAQVQIVQEELTFLRVRLVPGEEFGSHSRTAVAELVFSTFGEAMRHEIELLDRIPQEAGGKYRFCVSKVVGREGRALVA